MDDEHFRQARNRLEDTTSQLMEKLAALEARLGDAVESAGTVVEQTVENVQDAVSNVSETVQSVGEALDLRRQIERYPWIAVGGAVVVGFFAARWLGRTPPALIAVLTANQLRREEQARLPVKESPRSRNGHGTYSTASEPHPNGHGEPAHETHHSGIVGQSLNHLGGMILGSVAGVIGDLVRHSFAASSQTKGKQKSSKAKPAAENDIYAKAPRLR